MGIEQALAFVAFAIVAAITPGPSNAMLTVTGAVAGIRRGLPCLMGVAMGMALMMFVVGFGLGTLVLGNLVFVTTLKWCGAAFLLWLAWKITTARYCDSPDGGRPVGFVGAFVFQWLNPKSWLVSTSAAGTYFQSGVDVRIQAVWVAALFFIVVLACGFVWLTFGLAVRELLRSPRLHRAFNVTMGTVLALSVLLFVW